MTFQFQELPIGVPFQFHGRCYRKIALSMAQDEQSIGTLFLADTPVTWEPLPGESPLVLPKSDPRPWYSALSHAPGPKPPHRT